MQAGKSFLSVSACTRHTQQVQDTLPAATPRVAGKGGVLDCHRPGAPPTSKECLVRAAQLQTVPAASKRQSARRESHAAANPRTPCCPAAVLTLPPDLPSCVRWAPLATPPHPHTSVSAPFNL